MATATAPPQTRRSPLFLAAFSAFLFTTAFLAAPLIYGVVHAHLIVHDTLFFWESGRLLLHRHNPYDREAFRQMELAMDFPIYAHGVIMTLEPPLILPLLLPLGFLSGQFAVIAWSLFLLGCLGVSVWAVGDGLSPKYLAMVFVFPAAMYCVETGQTGILSLLGLALFLKYCDKKPLWAGAALSLCAFKPHLFLPFGVVVLVWALRDKRWFLLSGIAIAAAAESLIAMAFDTSIWSDYHRLASAPYFASNMIPRLGLIVSLFVHRRALWVDLTPAALASIWALWYFLKNRERWDWTTHGSILVIVSFLAAPHAWFTDTVILIPAVLFALRRRRKWAVELLLVLLTARALEAMTAHTVFDINTIADLVFGFLWLGWYCFATRTASLRNVCEAA